MIFSTIWKILNVYCGALFCNCLNKSQLKFFLILWNFHKGRLSGFDSIRSVIFGKGFWSGNRPEPSVLLSINPSIPLETISVQIFNTRSTLKFLIILTAFISKRMQRQEYTAFHREIKNMKSTYTTKILSWFLIWCFNMVFVHSWTLILIFNFFHYWSGYMAKVKIEFREHFRGEFTRCRNRVLRRVTAQRPINLKNFSFLRIFKNFRSSSKNQSV